MENEFKYLSKKELLDAMRKISYYCGCHLYDDNRDRIIHNCEGCIFVVDDSYCLFTDLFSPDEWMDIL